MSISFDTLIGVEATGDWNGSALCTHVATFGTVNHMSQFSFLRWAQSHMRLHYKKQEPYHFRSLFSETWNNKTWDRMKSEKGAASRDTPSPSRTKFSFYFPSNIQNSSRLHEPPPAWMPLNRVIVFHLLLNQFSVLSLGEGSPSFFESIFLEKKNPGTRNPFEKQLLPTFVHVQTSGWMAGAVFYHHALFLYHVHLPGRKEKNFFAHLVTIFLILSSKVTHHVT